MKRLLAACAVLIAAISIDAQSPSAHWRTITTEHFRVHYPAEYEAWATRATTRLESIFNAVSKEIGYTPADARIDVLIINPVAQANGMALPLLDTPRMVFFTEPPGPDETIGAYSNWIDLLAVHEVAHVVHMLRPSRNPLARLIERYVVPLNRITLDAPRWVLEGYATVIEGRLTGAGRPSSTVRALILRQWAAHGRLPSYDSLDTDDRFLGMSMAYLAGSAYLEWLEARGGESALRNLWTRMTARQRRSFDVAFEGVFGDSPERLYGQFVAELTASALAANRAEAMREGELWQETDWATGDPAVSPDGKQIVIVVRERDKPSKLVIWSTGAAEEEEKEYRERIEKMLKRDPEDIAPVRTTPLDREPLHSFTAPDGGGFSSPRWMSDGKSVLVTHRQPDADGVLHNDLFLWTPETGEWDRITVHADVRDADPFPDRRAAIAVRSRYGFSQLVEVDLESGAVIAINEPSIDVVYDHPRLSRDGRIAYVAHKNGRWSLFVNDRASNEVSPMALAQDESFASPEWTANGEELIATLMTHGFAELYRVTAGGARAPITRTRGGALCPAPSTDGRVFFMSLDPDGFVLRAIDSSGVAAPAPALDPSLVPAIPPRPAVAPPFAAQELAPSQPYGLGNQELTILGGGTLAPSQNATEIGIRLGDVVGRLDTIVLASFGSEDAQRGVAVASAWRGWPIEVSGHLFRSEDDRQDRSGAELRAMWDRIAPRGGFRAEAGILGGEPFDLAFAETHMRVFRISRSWTIRGEGSLGFESGSFRQIRGGVGGGVSRGSTRVAITYERRRLDDDGDHAIELGGLPSTIIPRSAFSNRVFEPALPVASLRSDDYQGVRVEATLPGFPLTLVYRRHELDEELAIVGAQIDVSSDPFPLLRLPGVDVTLGVARPITGPLERDTNWWLGLRWRP